MQLNLVFAAASAGYAVVMTALAIGLGVANFRAGRNKAQASAMLAQANAITAMQAQLDTQKDVIGGQATEIARLTARVEGLLEHNRTLSDLAKGRPDWDALAGLLRQQSEDHKGIVDALTVLADRLDPATTARRKVI